MMLLISTAIVRITEKASKFKSQILKSLHFSQENENHALLLPSLSKKNRIMNCCLKLISILYEGHYQARLWGVFSL